MIVSANVFVDSFNNREIALILWLALFIVVLLFTKTFWKSLPGIVGILISRKVLTVLIALVLYIGLVVLILYDVHFWDLSLLKDTLFWFLGVSLLLLFNVNKATENDKHFFKRVFLEAIAFTVLIAFVANFYAFPLWAEIIIYPSVVFLGLMIAVASTDEKYSSVKTFFEFVLAAYGFFLLGYGIYRMVINYHSFFTYDMLRTFTLPILLTITYIPFLYVCALYMDYDDLFIQVDLSISEDAELSRWTKKKLMRICHLNLKRLNGVKNKKLEFRRIRDKGDVLQLLDDFKQDYAKMSREGPLSLM